MSGLNPAATIIFCVLEIAAAVPATAQDGRRPPPSPSTLPSESLELFLAQAERTFGSTTVRVNNGPITEITVENPILRAEPVSDMAFSLTPLQPGQTRVTVHGEGNRVLYDKMVTVSETKRVQMLNYVNPGAPFGSVAYDCSPGCRPVSGGR